MPFRSRSQARYFFAAEARKELPKGTARTWAHHTKDIKSLPEKVKKKRKKKMKKHGALIVLGLRKSAERDEDEGPPNYRHATSFAAKCATCTHYSNAACTKYNVPVAPDFVCDAWEQDAKGAKKVQLDTSLLPPVQTSDQLSLPSLESAQPGALTKLGFLGSGGKVSGPGPVSPLRPVGFGGPTAGQPPKPLATPAQQSSAPTPMSVLQGQGQQAPPPPPTAPGSPMSVANIQQLLQGLTTQTPQAQPQMPATLQKVANIPVVTPTVQTIKPPIAKPPGITPPPPIATAAKASPVGLAPPSKVAPMAGGVEEKKAAALPWLRNAATWGKSNVAQPLGAWWKSRTPTLAAKSPEELQQIAKGRRIATGLGAVGAAGAGVGAVSGYNAFQKAQKAEAINLATTAQANRNTTDIVKGLTPLGGSGSPLNTLGLVAASGLPSSTAPPSSTSPPEVETPSEPRPWYLHPAALGAGALGAAGLGTALYSRFKSRGDDEEEEEKSAFIRNLAERATRSYRP